MATITSREHYIFFDLKELEKSMIMKRFSIFLLLLIAACVMNAQVSTENYIRTRKMLNDTGSSYLDDIAYYDGLGRPFQTVKKAVKMVVLQIKTSLPCKNMMPQGVRGIAGYQYPSILLSIWLLPLLRAVPRGSIAMTVALTANLFMKLRL